MDIQHVVCAVDLSDCSRRALEHAAAIARARQAKLTVLHTYTASAIEVDRFADDAPFDPVHAAEPSTALSEFAASAAGGQDVAVRLLPATDLRRAIVSEVATLGADLLVLGTHGQTRAERLFIGSTAEIVSRRVACPVLLVPAHAPLPESGRFKRIICGMDFSDASLGAFRYAVQIVAADDAEVTLTHAVERPAEVREMQLVAAFDVKAVRAATEAACLQRLERIATSDTRRCRIRPIVTEGRAYRQILRVADEQSADLVVLGAHSRGPVDRWLFGLNTHAILLEARCAVLTVPAAA